MKQIVLLGDLHRWKDEAEFITEMFHLTATGVITVNIGHKLIPADLNTKELRQLFPGKTLDDSIGSAISKLYSQGIADGILCLIGKDPSTSSTFAKAFAAMPFGLPKVAVLTGDSNWQGSRDILNVYLPGNTYSLSPVLKICLCNTVFAISGMCLCNIHNFGSKRPTIGITGCGAEAGDHIKNAGLNYLSFSADDNYIGALLHYGYLHGLILGDLNAYSPNIEIAAAKDIPVVCVGKSPEKIRSALASLTLPSFAPVIVVTSAAQDAPIFSMRPQAQRTPSPSPWLKLYNVSHKYGTDAFYKYIGQLLTELLV